MAGAARAPSAVAGAEYNHYYLREFGVQLPSSLPLCVGGGQFLRKSYRGLAALTSLKRYVFQGFMRVPSRFAVCVFFCSKYASHCSLSALASQTTVFVTYLGPWSAQAEKYQFL